MFYHKDFIKYSKASKFYFVNTGLKSLLQNFVPDNVMTSSQHVKDSFLDGR
jgi:hypothetical protein